MITETRADIDFSTFPSSDGEPMAETEINLDQMVDLILTLRRPLARQGHHVGGNLLVYYNPRRSLDHCSPDVFVALDAGPARRASWMTWIEGKFPEVVFEIASPSTKNTDIGTKVTLYERLGAREYYIFDPAASLDPAFRGYQAQAGRLRLLPNPTGQSITSPLLGLEFRVIAGWLRVINPITKQPFPTPEEEVAAREVAELRAARAERDFQQAEQARLRAERDFQQAEQARQQAERRAEQEAAARQESEAALQRALAMIDRLRSGGDAAPQ